MRVGKPKELFLFLSIRWDVKVPENAVGEYYNQLLLRLIGKQVDELTKEMPVCGCNECVMNSLYFRVRIDLLLPKYITWTINIRRMERLRWISS